MQLKKEIVAISTMKYQKRNITMFTIGYTTIVHITNVIKRRNTQL